MYKIVFLIILLLQTGRMYAQEFDDKIVSLINQRNWFALEENFKQYIDSIEDPKLKLTTQFILNRRFNQVDLALLSIDALLSRCKSDLGQQEMLYLIANKKNLLSYKGDYQIIADELKRIISENYNYLKETNQLSDYNIAFEFYDFIRKENKPIVQVPLNEDVEIPLRLLEMNFKVRDIDDNSVDQSKNIAFIIQINIHGNDYNFILDSGSSQTVIFDEVVKSCKIRNLGDTIDINGETVFSGHNIIIDSLSFGKVKAYNILAVSTQNILKKYAVFSKEQIANLNIGGYLGFDFLKRFAEIQIHTEGRKVIIPLKESPMPNTGRNIYIDNDENLVITAKNGESTFTMHFDTGNSDTFMFKSFYENNKDIIRQNLLKKCKQSLSYDQNKSSDITTDTIYEIPLMNLQIGDQNVSLQNIPIHIDNVFVKDTDTDGSLGLDFISKFDKITLNLNKMFIKMENLLSD